MIKSNLLHITNHTGKMAMIHSISTTCLNNKLCLARMNNNETICSHCFSVATQKRYSKLTAALQHNTEVLTSAIIPVEYLPEINDRFFRLESFGDLNNEVQVINFFNICAKNPDTDFALWTKNPWFIQKAIDLGYSKPDNLNIIFSSLFLNQVNDAFTARYTFIDKVFTVYDKDHAGSVDINCGARDCWSCKRCYRHHSGPVEYVNELLK